MEEFAKREPTLVAGLVDIVWDERCVGMQQTLKRTFGVIFLDHSRLHQEIRLQIGTGRFVGSDIQGRRCLTVVALHFQRREGSLNVGRNWQPHFFAVVNMHSNQTANNR